MRLGQDIETLDSAFRDFEPIGKPRFVIEDLELALRVSMVIGKMEAAVALGKPQVGEHHLPLEKWQGQAAPPLPWVPAADRRSVAPETRLRTPGRSIPISSVESPGWR